MARITKPGRYQLTMAEYRPQCCDALCLSSSDAVKLAETSPKHLKAAWSEPNERARKADLGTAIHAMALEPARASSQIVIIKANDFKTNAAKDAADEALNAGKTPLLEKDYERAGRAVEALRSDPDAGPLLASGNVEESWFARDKVTGLYFKARPDLFTPSEILIDVKTVGSAHPDFIERRIYEGGWYQQAPWHCDVVTRVLGHQPEDYLWVIVEQDPPYDVVVKRPKPDALAAGQRKNAEAIATVARCVKTGKWPGYGGGISEAGLPSWAHYRLEEAAMASPGMEAAALGLTLETNPFG